jgi:acetyl-CoA synthetase
MGAIALPVSSLFGPDAIRYRLDDSGAKAVVVGEMNLVKVREALAGRETHPAMVVVGDAGPGEVAYAAALSAASADFRPAVTAAEDPCLLLYTSGTTGNPKGVLHAHRMFCGLRPALAAVHPVDPQPGDVLWSPADWAWTAGLMGILLPAWWHGHPVVVDLDTAFAPERALQVMAEHRVTLALLPPTALRMIRASGLAAEGLSLRTVVSGGEAQTCAPGPRSSSAAPSTRSTARPR